MLGRSILGACVVSLLALPFAAAQDEAAREEQAKQKFQEAKALVERKDHEKALVILRELEEKYADTKLVSSNRSGIKTMAETSEKMIEASKAARAMVVDDFEDKEAESHWTPSHHWKSLKVKTASCTLGSEGPKGSKALEVKLHGAKDKERPVTGVLANVTRRLATGIPTGTKGIRFLMRATNTKKVSLLFAVDSGNRYEAKFNVTGEWKEVVILWKDLMRMPKEQRIEAEELPKIKVLTILRRDGLDSNANFNTDNDPDAEVAVVIDDVTFVAGGDKKPQAAIARQRGRQWQAHPNATTSLCRGHCVTWPMPMSPNVYFRGSPVSWKRGRIRARHFGHAGYSTPWIQHGQPDSLSPPMQSKPASATAESTSRLSIANFAEASLSGRQRTQTFFSSKS